MDTNSGISIKIRPNLKIKDLKIIFYIGAVETHRTYILFYTVMYFLLLYISMISLSYIHLCLLMFANIHYKRGDRI